MPDRGARGTVAAVKIGFFGGSFDPIHFGHLVAAQDALEQLGLDRLVLMPAAQAPLKPSEVAASAEDRLAMVRLAAGVHPRFEVSDHEVRRGGVNYTVDTVRHFRSLNSEDRLLWVIGADQLARLPEWREIGELVRLVEFAVLDRPGHPAGEECPVPGLRLHRVPGHAIDISSTELRERARRGLPLDCFVPQKAVEYIRERRLYL